MHDASLGHVRAAGMWKLAYLRCLTIESGSTAIVSRTRRSTKWCDAEPGPRADLWLSPGSAAHRHSASKTRVNALLGRCAASGARRRGIAATSFCDLSPQLPPRWRSGRIVATLTPAKLRRASGAIYPRGLIDPLGNCPWPGPWTRTYGAHLLS